MTHQFFQQFNGPQQPQQQQPSVTKEDMILEIYNNWSHVRWLLDRQRNGDKFKLLQVDADWINFLTQSQIDIESFNGDKEEFANKYIK